jgi:hypothetical protein
LNIAGPILQGASALTKLAELATLKSLIPAAEALGEASSAERNVLTFSMINNLENIVRVKNTIMIIQKGEALTNLGLISYKTSKDLAMVAEVYADDPKKLAAMQSEIIKNALISGTFAMIALHSEFKMRNADELETLVSSLIKERDYDTAMIRSGLKDANGNWRNPKMQELFLKNVAKEEHAAAGKLKTETKPIDEGDHHVDQHERDRGVQMKGHAESPDGLHEVEAYPDGTVGRCSPTGAGQKCPVLRLEFGEVLNERPVAKKELADLEAEIAKYGENVPQAKMDALAQMEQRLRGLQQVKTNSSAPKNYKIMEVSYDFDDVTPLAGNTILEYPGGERIWRNPGGGVQHEAVIGTSIGRQGMEKGYYSATESGLPTFKGTERAHSFGQGFGWESPFGLYNAPRFVNQRLQNNGIEQFIRTVRDIMPAGQKIVLHTTTKPVPGSRRLQSVKYEGFIQTASGEKIPAFNYEINVTWKKAGGSVVDAMPIKFETNSNPAKQQLITDFEGLLPKADMPEPIINTIHEDIN